MNTIDTILQKLTHDGNMRSIPHDDARPDLIDLSSNDYLGISTDLGVIERFCKSLKVKDYIMSATASRLLASRQREYTELEKELGKAYNREALLFNSGYHANTGIIKALGSKKTLFLADKLVHASIIDGLNLAVSSGATFMRFRHNDYDHLEKLMNKYGKDFVTVVIISESVYSMDGDRADLDALTRIRDMHPGCMIYLDEAHAVGVLGEKGLGLAYDHENFDKIDIVVGTFGKALASVGAFAIVSPTMRDFLVNTARSLIFSTAIPPLNAKWSLETLRFSMAADERRARLRELGCKLSEILGNEDGSHIQPLILGDPRRAIEASKLLAESGYRVLPIRTPTVPAGTERLRFSLSASLPDKAIEDLAQFVERIKNP